MAASAKVPDLGLDLRKLPNLADPDTRTRLSPSGIQAFFKIVKHWALKNEDSMALFGGMSHGRYYDLKRDLQRRIDSRRAHARLPLDRHFQGFEYSFRPKTGESMGVTAKQQSDIQQCPPSGSVGSRRRTRLHGGPSFSR